MLDIVTREPGLIPITVAIEGSKVEVALPGSYRLSPAELTSIKALPGVRGVVIS